MWKPFAYLLLLSLTACSGLFSEEKVTTPSPPGVSYRADSSDPAATDAKAQDYCGRYGKKAKRESSSKSGNDTIVAYSCN